MLSVLPSALLRLGLLALIGIVVGFVFGVVPALAVVIVGLVILLAIHMTYATRLADWLETPVLDRIPNGWGLWSDVFARLYRQRRATETNERRLLENEERFRRTISALPEGIVLVDASLQIDWCNPVAEQHLGVRLSRGPGATRDEPRARSRVRSLSDIGPFRVPADLSSTCTARCGARSPGRRL